MLAPATINPAQIIALVIVVIIVVIDLIKVFDAPIDNATDSGESDNIDDSFDYRRCNSITRTGDLCKCWAKVGFSQCRWHTWRSKIR